jgi:8-oxo-dGTP pyrophosphatase MutT (NUDIX family)
MLRRITEKLKKFPIDQCQPSPQDHGSTAAVMLLLHGAPDNPQVLLTQRAEHLNNHAGEVAFPGGMWDIADSDLLQTALRETHEEIGLSAGSIEPIAMLPSTSPRLRWIKVTPFVGLVEDSFVLRPEPSEIAAIFDVPLSIFTDVSRYQYFEIKNEMGALSFPFLEYQGYKIWGLTLNVLVGMLNSTLNSAIVLNYPSDELIEELTIRGQK